MRLELLWNLRLLCERLATASLRQRRLRKLLNTPARNLSLGHIESLELLEMAAVKGINVIYDIGANVGTWTLLAKTVIPGAVVEAFEPLPAHQDGFAKTCGGMSGITLHPVALGPKNATMPLRVTSFSDASSILPIAKASHDHFGLTEVCQVPIPVRRLDDYCLTENFRFADLIKVDVQGFELEVLSGGISVLAHTKALIVEVSFVKLYENQCTFPELCSFLEEQDFRIHAFGASTPVGTPLVQADVLFLKC
ncbi:MAG: FkbM family methyltransferase [Burkholderiales bacterium]|nr:FkbM family methyltransferase [Burkholderiales bacterium]